MGLAEAHSNIIPSLISADINQIVSVNFKKSKERVACHWEVAQLPQTRLPDTSALEPFNDDSLKS